MSAKLLMVFFLLSVFQACSRKVEEDDFDDFTTNQKWVMSPKTHDTDVTLLLNKLLREYDKKLRPDIGTSVNVECRKRTRSINLKELNVRVKPTVIDVDIYVNSIGPVSSINMDLQDALDKTLEKSLEKTAELLAQESNELRKDIVLALQGLAGLVEKIDNRVDEVVGNVEILQDRVEKIEENVDATQNDIIISQYREMEHALRIRGLKENIKENLREEIAAELASILEVDPEEMLKDIEKIFRVNSWVAKQRKLPRDVVVYFARKSLRNEIIQAFYKQRFQIAAQDVIVLKEIPSKILRKRKDFAFLAEELKKRQIQCWLWNSGS